MATAIFSAGAIWYINKVDKHGWLKVLKASNQNAFLPEYTKLQITESKNRRVYFKVLDGFNAGMLANLQDINASEYLGRKAPLQTPVVINVRYGKEEEVFSDTLHTKPLQQTATLTVEGVSALITLNTSKDPRRRLHTPLPPGKYKVGLPLPTHDKDMTSYYRKTQPDLRADQIWFPIEYGNNTRFVHVGNVSHGCVTVMALDKWNAVYQAIISHRVPGTNDVGYIVVAK